MPGHPESSIGLYLPIVWQGAPTAPEAIYFQKIKSSQFSQDGWVVAVGGNFEGTFQRTRSDFYWVSLP